mgnify:FL=1
MIKHISLNFWNTLMVSNKIFSDLKGIILAVKGNKYDKIPEYTKNLKKIIKLHFLSYIKTDN